MWRMTVGVHGKGEMYNGGYRNNDEYGMVSNSAEFIHSFKPFV